VYLQLKKKRDIESIIMSEKMCHCDLAFNSIKILLLFHLLSIILQCKTFHSHISQFLMSVFFYNFSLPSFHIHSHHAQILIIACIKLHEKSIFWFCGHAARSFFLFFAVEYNKFGQHILNVNRTTPIPHTPASQP
jgi:hypothetical protein